MVELLILKLICIPLFFTIALICGLSPRFSSKLGNDGQEKFLSLGNAFAAGVFLAVGFEDLLRESIGTFTNDLKSQYPVGLTLCAVGFLIMFGVEKVFFSPENADNHFVEKSVNENTKLRSANIDESLKGEPKNIFSAFLLLFSLSFHSSIAGLVLGLQPNFDSWLQVFIAIIAHQWLGSIALGVSIMRVGVSGKKMLQLILIFAVCLPIGIGIGTAISQFSEGIALVWIRGILTGIASGTFIYVATFDILAHEFALDHFDTFTYVCTFENIEYISKQIFTLITTKKFDQVKFLSLWIGFIVLSALKWKFAG